MGERLRKNLTAPAPAEDAPDASPAIPAAETAAAPAAERRRATEAELAAALAHFGWQVPEQAGAQELGLPGEAPEMEAEHGPWPSLEELLGEGETEGTELAEAEDVKEFTGSSEWRREPSKGEGAADPEKEETHIFSRKDTDTLAVQPSAPERKKPVRSFSSATLVRPSRKPKEPVPPKEEAPAVQYRERDYMPIRRSRSYRTGLRGGLMYFGFVVCVSAILASLGWLAADDVLSLNKPEQVAEIYVGEDRDMEQVALELSGKGLVKYKSLFLLFAKLMKAETKVDPGIYTISSRLDYNAMIHAMQRSRSGVEERSTVMVTIPEGKTLKQTFQILAEHGVCPYETLLECAADREFDYDFLEELPYGEENRLEGYLFPDTYEFFAPSSPEEAIDKFLSNFDAKMNDEMMLTVAGSGYSLREILTVASLIEMEVGTDTERATIASVIYNRLNSSAYPFLQIDATIQYALEERKPTLTVEDLEIDSPYNTYKYTGLPPGPIANPGLASIRAALEPESTGYYFYALNKHGSHNFFTTQSQFEYFVYSSDFGG